MTLCAFAAFTPAMENPKTIPAAVIHETNELRISVPIGAPGKGAVSAYRERDRSAKPFYPVFSSFLCLLAVSGDYSSLSITHWQLA
jgi:hypothetical protein